MAQLLRHTLVGCIIGLALYPASLLADDVRVAVASNFLATLRLLAQPFEAETGHRLRISAGATGKHYAQILRGAPFDVFLAADAQRPALLEQQGMGVPGSRQTYALGRLALWSPDPQPPQALVERLRKGDFRCLAIPNPALAPYGQAAESVMAHLAIPDGQRRKRVMGENVNQTLQFVKSGNADLGFVALSQVRQADGTHWIPGPSLYPPITQQALLLRDTVPAKAFMAFLDSRQARSLILSQGYGLP